MRQLCILHSLCLFIISENIKIEYKHKKASVTYFIQPAKAYSLAKVNLSADLTNFRVLIIMMNFVFPVFLNIMKETTESLKEKVFI